jgi:hypothetical protein
MDLVHEDIVLAGEGRKVSIFIPALVFLETIKIKKKQGKIPVGIATDYGLNDQGIRVRFPVKSRIFYSPRRLD